MEQTVAKLQARVGDIIVVSGHRLGEPVRTGEILEVLGDSQSRHFRVRWDDDHESVFYPGPDTTVRPARSEGH